MKCTRCLLQLLGQSAHTAARLARPTLPRNPQHEQAVRRFRGNKGGPVPAEFVGEDPGKRSVVPGDPFATERKTKASFAEALEVFAKADVRRRGHVEFIYAALKKMPEFGVERDLAVYNQLLDVFPKEVFVPRNFIQRMFNHYPRQQECAVQLLEQMENYGVMPNVETKVLLVRIFGEKGHPVRKYQRIMYWFPKFKHANPFPIPHQLPEDPVDLARFSLKRIANHLDAKVSVYQMPRTDVTDSGDQIGLPHIVGIQSPDQMELLGKHDPGRPVFVEGPFPLWLRKTCVHYYVLRAEPVPPGEKVEEPYDPERCFNYPLQLQLDLDRDLGDIETFDVEDLDEGPVFAMCMTSQGDRATLNRWISGLQESNPVLGHIPTLFRLQAGASELRAETRRDESPAEEPEEEEEARRRRN
ncbi:evolutionarily conserved signaling intermediate in Toll pathway, mitochondrial isoform X1 [Phyllopteryx taeniolatus]|uniref:evolutionarily conserved signaling intermediate in Toll pathway, mitochondrial isoform X1 n=1 Tax=Phyllopteryx taeniolatus TaxID=161469 RepID=UPI002AD3DCA5|nr:evolutionarily conserved signaling intermediate in Toll pathway, mitochondrial isoform X1 [Phyllopteryx taeniolatus]XP_061619101.1 evolutionarily conserved signaling intermediate in Toll pathway, mitochondrial isoform X1 [Phyllopteryx taeniolatus]XP_061619102.1 evolutionarily conserved signaling intermediate in Toll pathway, mitochondrial isoform X1 [Phyllopteryx taeniolatus]